MGKNAIFDFFYHITASFLGDGNYNFGVALGLAVFVSEITVFLIISCKVFSFIIRRIRRPRIRRRFNEGAKK